MCEIGIFSSRYSAAYINDNKIERFRKVAKEAAKQCLRSRVPQVSYHETLADALNSCGGYENKLFACEFANESEADLRTLKGSAALVVGSEGGFTEEEFAKARALGFAGVSLGRRILRAETAAIAFTGIVTYLLGDLGCKPSYLRSDAR